MIDYTTHLLTILPTWLVGKKNYTGGKILADNTAAAQYARTQHQIQPNTTKPKQAEQTATPPQHKTPDLDSVKSLTPVINQLKNQLLTLQATVNLQRKIIAQLIQDSKTASTMASTLPSQIESFISRVDLLITTASTLYIAHMDDTSTRMASQLNKMQQVHLEQAKNANTEQHRKFDMFSDVTEIGKEYNGVCTSYGKCIHGVGNELLLPRATSARLNNQIEFIINHIMAQSKYLEGNGLFEAFQQNHKKWSAVEAGIYAEYMRGEGTLSPNTLRQKHKAEQNHNDSYTCHKLHQQ